MLSRQYNIDKLLGAPLGTRESAGDRIARQWSEQRSWKG